MIEHPEMAHRRRRSARRRSKGLCGPEGPLSDRGFGIPPRFPWKIRKVLYCMRVSEARQPKGGGPSGAISELDRFNASAPLMLGLRISDAASVLIYARSLVPIVS